MDRTGETVTNRDGKAEEVDGTLKSIAALLLSFAALAERTVTASAPLRFFVLWILRYAESVAWNLVAKEVFGEDIPPDARHTPIRTGNGAEDAALLALSFRALADALKKLAREEEMFERRLARWERKAERDDLQITFGNGHHFCRVAIAKARKLHRNAAARPSGISLGRLSTLASARASPVAFIDTS